MIFLCLFLFPTYDFEMKELMVLCWNCKCGSVVNMINIIFDLLKKHQPNLLSLGLEKMLMELRGFAKSFRTSLRLLF